MQNNQDIPRRQGRRLIEPLTFNVEAQTKERYMVLTQTHKIQMAELLRRVLKPLLETTLADAKLGLAEKTGSQDRERLRNTITLWVDQETFDLYSELRNEHPEVERAERVRAVFAKEINRVWAIEMAQLPNAS